MQVTKTMIPEVLIIDPEVFEDGRGFFFESFNQKKFAELTGLDLRFVQDNHSKSAKGVLRGLHFQKPPFAQGKLLRVVAGKIFDVAVDIRKDSPTFGVWTSAYLSAENKKQFWIPPGFAHGFLSLENGTELLYKATDFYNPRAEGCIRWDDSTLNIPWATELKKIGLDAPLLSFKDMTAVPFSDLDLFLEE